MGCSMDCMVDMELDMGLAQRKVVALALDMVEVLGQRMVVELARKFVFQ
jgi:hypothetical protein